MSSAGQIAQEQSSGAQAPNVQEQPEVSSKGLAEVAKETSNELKVGFHAIKQMLNLTSNKAEQQGKAAPRIIHRRWRRAAAKEKEDFSCR